MTQHSGQHLLKHLFIYHSAMMSYFPGDRKRSASVDTQGGLRPQKVARTDRQDDAAEQFGYDSRGRWMSPSGDIRQRLGSPSPHRDCLDQFQPRTLSSGLRSPQGLPVVSWEEDADRNAIKQESSSDSDSSYESECSGYSPGSERGECRGMTFRDRERHERRQRSMTYEQRRMRRDRSHNQQDRRLQSTSQTRQNPHAGGYRRQSAEAEVSRHGRGSTAGSYEHQATIPRPLESLIEKGEEASLLDVLKMIPVSTEQLKQLLSGALGQPERAAGDTERQWHCEQSGHVQGERGDRDHESRLYDKLNVKPKPMDSQQMRRLLSSICGQQGKDSADTDLQQSERHQQSSVYDRLQLMSKAKDDDQQGKGSSSENCDRHYYQQPSERDAYDRLQQVPKTIDSQPERDSSFDSYDQEYYKHPPKRQFQRGQRFSVSNKQSDDRRQRGNKLQSDNRGQRRNKSLSDDRGQQRNKLQSDDRGERGNKSQSDDRREQRNKSQSDDRGEQRNKSQSDDRREQRNKSQSDDRREQRNKSQSDDRREQRNKSQSDDRREQRNKSQSDDHREQRNKSQSDDRREQRNKSQSDDRGEQRNKLQSDDRGEQRNKSQSDDHGERGNKSQSDDRGERGNKSQSDDRGERGNKSQSDDRGERGNKSQSDDRGERGNKSQSDERRQRGNKTQSDDRGQRGSLPTAMEGLEGTATSQNNINRQEPREIDGEPDPGVSRWDMPQRLTPRHTDVQNVPEMIPGSRYHRFSFKGSWVPMTDAVCTESGQQQSSPQVAVVTVDSSAKEDKESSSRPTTTPAPSQPQHGHLQKSAPEPGEILCTVRGVIT